jgi:glutathione S-transferase
VVRRLVKFSDATEENLRRDLAALPRLLDHVDSLIADGTIGGDEPNAADFQIGTTVRVLLSYEDLHDRIVGRPCGELAMRLLPDYPGPIPSFLRRDWLEGVW